MQLTKEIIELNEQLKNSEKNYKYDPKDKEKKDIKKIRMEYRCAHDINTVLLDHYMSFDRASIRRLKTALEELEDKDLIKVFKKDFKDIYKEQEKFIEGTKKAKAYHKAFRFGKHAKLKDGLSKRNNDILKKF